MSLTEAQKAKIEEEEKYRAGLKQKAGNNIVIGCGGSAILNYFYRFPGLLLASPVTLPG